MKRPVEERLAHVTEPSVRLDALVLESRIRAEFLHILVSEKPELLAYDEIQSGIREILGDLAWLTRQADEESNNRGREDVAASMADFVQTT